MGKVLVDEWKKAVPDFRFYIFYCMEDWTTLCFLYGFFDLFSVHQGLYLCKTVCNCNCFCWVRFDMCFWRCQSIPCQTIFSDRRLLIDSGMFLRIEGGWLNCLCTYNGMFPTFVYGKCFPLVRLSVTCEKLTLYKLASEIFGSFSWKILQRSFFSFSISCGILLNADKTSSR